MKLQILATGTSVILRTTQIFVTNIVMIFPPRITNIFITAASSANSIIVAIMPSSVKTLVGITVAAPPPGVYVNLKATGGNYVYKGENLNNLKKKLGADDAKAKKDCPEPDDEAEANNDAELGIDEEPAIEPEPQHEPEPQPQYEPEPAPLPEPDLDPDYEPDYEPEANNDAELYDEPDANNDAELYGVE